MDFSAAVCFIQGIAVAVIGIGNGNIIAAAPIFLSVSITGSFKALYAYCFLWFRPSERDARRPSGVHSLEIIWSPEFMPDADGWVTA